MKDTTCLIVFLALVCLAVSPLAAQQRGFEHVADYVGVGATLATTVGPGPENGQDQFYASYIYGAGAFQIVRVDPDSRKTKVFESPVPTEQGAYGLVVAPDHKLYLGSLPNAHLMELDPDGDAIHDLGRPSSTEEYIWNLCVGSDGALYGGTFPNAKLIRYDLTTKQMTDLGRMDPTQQYTRTVAASGDGFVYAGVGSAIANIAAYQIATGQKRAILNPNPPVTGFAQVYTGPSGIVYAELNGKYYRLQQWQAIPISAGDAEKADEHNTLRDGRGVQLNGLDLQVTAKGARQQNNITQLSTAQPNVVAKANAVPLNYRGGKLPISRIVCTHNEIHGSTAMPLRLFRIQAATKALSEVGEFGKGELYSALYSAPYLYMANYAAEAPLLRFDPEKPVSTQGPDQNPTLVHFQGEDDGWRPKAMIAGPDGRVYVGAEPGYGQLGGTLVAWDKASNTAIQFPGLVQDQSIESLTTWKNLIVGGSSIRGGSGTPPTQQEAKLFLWDPATKKKIFEVVPVPGADSITNLIAMPNGLIFGFAGNTPFAFNPGQPVVIPMGSGPVNSPIYASLSVAPDGRIWGLQPDALFVIDPGQRQVSVLAHAPCEITAGAGMIGRSYYFACGAAVWRYTP
jgi:hypothetical protein